MHINKIKTLDKPYIFLGDTVTQPYLLPILVDMAHTTCLLLFNSKQAIY